ncbi:MAG: c-type cytochrome [Bacteroidia bacterium]
MPDNDSSANQTEQTGAAETPAAEAPAADDGKGVGPVKSVEVGASVDQSMAEKGKVLFEAKCTACHNTDENKKVGPGLAKVTERRKPEWIMNMILNPEKMVQEDPTAKELLATYLAPMANQSLTEEESRHILEYFRKNDSK